MILVNCNNGIEQTNKIISIMLGKTKNTIIIKCCVNNKASMEKIRVMRTFFGKRRLTSLVFRTTLWYLPLMESNEEIMKDVWNFQWLPLKISIKTYLYFDSLQYTE